MLIFINFGLKFYFPVIQRIQSVYLFLAFIVSAVLIMLLPLYRGGAEPLSILNDPIFLGITVLSALISLFSIFRYRNRQQQVVAGRINIIINFVLFGLIIWRFYEFKTEDYFMAVGSYMPIVAVILITLANRAIMKDEALVRAADRFR